MVFVVIANTEGVAMTLLLTDGRYYRTGHIVTDQITFKLQENIDSLNVNQMEM